MRMVHVAWADQVLQHYGKRILDLNERFPKVLPRIINQVGNRAKTQVIRNLTKQTGLPRKTIVKAVGDPAVARPGRLSYEMVTRGGNIRLKYLGARETETGVVAKPFGKTTLYPGAFMRGGRFPNRKEVAKFDGHAFYRLNRSGTKITFARSGVFIPTEMTRGATKAAFDRIAGPLLQQRVDAAMQKLVP
ncbi:hypothetical protein [Rhizobium sp. SSA_523]|uniref:hypothetical protein n=1 Tax=Rhizobium sp. SSA_523 TaxID=2952477 RepID=UPI0020903CF5|nr:hypothetical protein [Rhizobium sp. SSA_523]MCO5734115.1 hypothetical protein [Rhizobium sp. SSA_523]WKC24752.1 hypothetical protein QTJ18_12050 [Rhizobium sp. SSA_523]